MAKNVSKEMVVMSKKTAGIHHITAIVGHPQENVDFYAGVLGLRLVKQTVNFDDPGTYHLYFGNEGGKPGTIITFFPWANARQGKIGDGQVGVTSYVVPKGAMDFWEQRLAKFGIPAAKMERFGEQYLEFDDPHGLHLEIVEREEGEKIRGKLVKLNLMLLLKDSEALRYYPFDLMKQLNY